MKNTMFICSVGGHLTQMLQLEDIFDKYNSVLVTDKTTVTKKMKKKYNVKFLKHCSRQYLLSFLFLFFINTFKSLYLFFKYKPNVIVTTGANTAVPMCYIGWLFKRKIIFIESFAKRTTPTLSGKLVHPIATKFIVQWESMLKHYPKAEYWGWIY